MLSVTALAIDTAMCGRLPNAESALSALGFAAQIAMLLMVAMMGLVVGTVALVARAHGARQVDRVNHILHQSVQVTVLLGVVVAVLGNWAAPSLLRLLGAQGEALDAGLAYLRPILSCAVLYYLNILYAAVLRGVGNTALAFRVALLSNAVNVLANYCLILGNWGAPRLGVAGAGIGTALSYLVGVVVLGFVLRRGGVPPLELSFAPRPIDRAVAREFYRVGLPAALDMVILNAGFLSVVGMLGRIQEAAVAAHGVGLRVQALAFVPGMSIAQASSAVVGQALGARDVAQARAVVRASAKLCVGIMTALGVIFLLGAPWLIQLFDVSPGEPVGDFSMTWIRILGCAMPVVGVHIAAVGMLQGAGATRLSLRFNLVSTLLVQIPMSYFLGFVLGLGPVGVWLGFPLSFVIKAGLGAWAYRSGVWAQVGTRPNG